MSLFSYCCSLLIQSLICFFLFYFFFFFNDTATTEIYTLSLHDALPISSTSSSSSRDISKTWSSGTSSNGTTMYRSDRKSTRLNSSHVAISYAVFCLKKKKKKKKNKEKHKQQAPNKKHKKRTYIQTST